MRFELKERDGLARICILETKHAKIETPALLPVINPNKILIEPKELKRLFNLKILITNSYIIYRSDRLREDALERGIHELLDFDGAIMTDSGTFQSYVYGDIDIDPLEIVDFQRRIGSDIGTILDLFVTPDDSYPKARKKVKETLKRARESLRIRGEMILSCPIQGGLYDDLRSYCAREISGMDCEVTPIGGVVPLMENQRYAELVKVIISSRMHLSPSKVVHLLGAGHPIIFPIAIALGVDLLDSASYAKYARDDRMIFPWGTEKLQDLKELPCNCPVCARTDVKDLLEMEKEERERRLALHNLYVCFSEIRRIKNAIRDGEIWEIVEEKANQNPMLMDALRELRDERIKEWLERFENLSKRSALFYRNTHTLHRPVIYRYQRRLLERYVPRSREVVFMEEVEKPYGKVYRKVWEGSSSEILVDSPIGPVPLPLDEMYPVAQSVFPRSMDEESKSSAEELKRKLLERFGMKPIKRPRKGKRDLDIDRIRYTLDMQFGRGVSDVLLDGEIDLVKSKTTGKIRNVYLDGRHILSMRAHDGFFTLKIEGARILHNFYSPPRFRVIIEDEAIDFVRKGRNVFSRFVVDCDSRLRPFDECLIVSKDDDLIAVGRTLLNREEMLAFEYGVAVKTREVLK